jgi:hypothetical protein
MITIKDRWELLALHRALFEAKLHSAPEDRDIVGSPVLARLAERVVDELIAAETREGDANSKTRWGTWRRASEHPQRVNYLRAALQAQKNWAGYDELSRRTFLIDALAPLVAEEYEIQQLLKEADAFHKQKAR